MTFVLSFDGPVDLVHALESDLVRRGISSAWVRARADMRELSVKHVEPDGLSRTQHQSEALWPSVELEGMVSNSESTRLHVRGVRASEFGYVHIAGELCGGLASRVSVLVLVLGDSGHTTRAPSAPEFFETSRSTKPPEERGARGRTVAAPTAPPAAGSPWAAVLREAEKHEEAPAASGDKLPRRGDQVDHFAFGRCEIVKCDGERAHLRLAKDGRIKELALDLLKITLLGFEPGGARRYKFDRKV